MISTAKNYLPKILQIIDDTFLVPNESLTIVGETARNNDLKFCTKRDLFAYH